IETSSGSRKPTDCKDSDSHPPLLPGGSLPVCTGPSPEIRIGKATERKGKKDRRPNAFFRARRDWHSQKKALSKGAGNMTVYGYARVSTDGQSLTSQDAELHAASCAKVRREDQRRSEQPTGACQGAQASRHRRCADRHPARPLGTLDAGLAQYPR